MYINLNKCLQIKRLRKFIFFSLNFSPYFNIQDQYQFTLREKYIQIRCSSLVKSMCPPLLKILLNPLVLCTSHQRNYVLINFFLYAKRSKYLKAARFFAKCISTHFVSFPAALEISFFYFEHAVLLQAERKSFVDMTSIFAVEFPTGCYALALNAQL